MLGSVVFVHDMYIDGEIYINKGAKVYVVGVAVDRKVVMLEHKETEYSMEIDVFNLLSGKEGK